MASTFMMLAFVLSTNAQTDTEFWFVAPEITSGHSDSPILLRVSSLNQIANVQISQPANAAFPVINATIAAGSTQTFDLTPYKAIIENAPENTVLNYGLLLQSSSPVTAYYEVNGTNNPDIFALKGSNAKGTDFYTPLQTFFVNGVFTPISLSGFDIVATEDNTSVTITPSVAMVGHAAGTPFTVVLNTGQTYSCIATGINVAEHATGSHVTSSKPICVTIKDDSMVNGSCRDMMGDQIVPTNVIGTEYIVMRGFLNSDEHVFILATEDGTDITVDGTFLSTLNTGQQADVTLPFGTATRYIQASAPVYVLHVAGFGCEMGGALLPSIECTGSNTVFFTRATSELFGLNIMVKNGSQNNFLLNGNASLVPGSAFTVVPGTNSAWVAAQISFDQSQVPVGTTSFLTTTATSNELFHLGIINGGASSGCRYGYFSDFSSTNLGGNRVVCAQDSVELDAGPNKDSYLWSTGDITQTITVFEEGVYWVNTVKDGCAASDTVTVARDNTIINLGNDTTLCDSQTLLLSAGPGYTSYQWSVGGSDSTLLVNSANTIAVEVSSFAGCVFRDTIVVEYQIAPSQLTIDGSGNLCEGDDLSLTANGASGDVTWIGPNNFTASGSELTIESIQQLQAGQYQVSQTVGECPSIPATISISITELPQPEISGDTLLCEGELSNLTAGGGPFDAFIWSTGETTQSIESVAGQVILTATTDGCSASDTVNVLLEEPIAQFFMLPDTIVFVGSTTIFNDSSIASANAAITGYFWNFGDGSAADAPVVNYTYQTLGDYQVIYTVVNEFECIDTVIQNVSVIREVIIPNAFSPNGDGFNDVFKIKYLEVFPNSQLVIFNRWGNSIYQSENYQNDWDGEDHPDGTYFYVLDLPNNQGNYKGTVFLTRK